jgi:hypothetical protein
MWSYASVGVRDEALLAAAAKVRLALQGDAAATGCNGVLVDMM